MARQRTGSVEYRNGRWFASLTLGGAAAKGVPVQRRRVPLDPTIGPDDRDRAKAEAAKLSASFNGGSAGHVVKETDLTRGLSCTAWWKKYLEAAEAGQVGKSRRPQTDVENRRGAFRNWIEPYIGGLAMAKVQPEHLEDIRENLLTQVRAREAWRALPEPRGVKVGTSEKTAKRIWGEVVTAFGQASRRGDRAIAHLRVRDDNPATAESIEGLKLDGKRDMAALNSAEVVALLGCELVPLIRRRLYAVAIYTGLRQGELRGLNVSDVDLASGVVNVRGQRKSDGATKGRTKTAAAVRSVPTGDSIRSGRHLQPLLRVMTEGKPGDTPLLAVPKKGGSNRAALLVRQDMLTAGITREDLYRDDDLFMPFNFHGLRHTAVTHWEANPETPGWLLTAIGHTSKKTTKGYTDFGALIRAQNFGEAHPPLPANLIKPLSLAPDKAHATGTECESSLLNPVAAKLPIELTNTVDALATNSNRRRGGAGLRRVRARAVHLSAHRGGGRPDA